MIRFLFQCVIVVVTGCVSLLVAVGLLMTMGVAVVDHQDYFSPGSDASTPESGMIGAAILLAAAAIGFGGPLWLIIRRSGHTDHDSDENPS